MVGVIEGRAAPARLRGGVKSRRAMTLSVCCMTSGRRPDLLAGILAALRPVADEIVVAVEAGRAAGVRDAVAGVADTVLAFPATSPADRPIAWLFRSCSGDWIFNIDDDEVPSPALVAGLPALVRRTDITHAWVARRWLHPTEDTYIASAPWGTEFQLRFALADDRFLQFSDAFHRPVVCHGPSAYVEEPLWHLDTVLNPAALRRLKAAAYERERPGMRFGGLAHNLGVYVPELERDLDLLPVPPEARDAIRAARAFRPARDVPPPTVVRVAADDIDRNWVGAPYEDSLYSATLVLSAAPAAMRAGVQHTVDVRVTNGSDRTWRWGKDARPEIKLAYRWFQGDEDVREPTALRTFLPADLPPGATQVVPVHVVAPEAAGSYVLEIDLVHEGVRWFGLGAQTQIEVRDHRRIAVLARPERVHELVAALDVRPEVEPVVQLRDADDRGAYGDFDAVVGLRRYMLHGTEGRSRLGTFARLLLRAALLTRRSRLHHWSHPEYASVLSHRDSTECLVVDGPNWAADAAFGREWAWVVETALLWRLAHRPVVIRDHALPSGQGLRVAVVRWLLRQLRTAA